MDTQADTTNLTSPAGSAATCFVEAQGIRFAFRRLGAAGEQPLLFLQHFTGTMDSWDPAVVDGFARQRPVILLDNAGVGASGGVTPDTVDAMVAQTLAFIAALGLTRLDILGFSLGGFIAQIVAAQRPDLVRRTILAGTGPQGSLGLENLPELLVEARHVSPVEPRLFLFFDRTESSQSAGRAFIARQARRTENRDPDTRDQSVRAQLRAIVRWGASIDHRAAGLVPFTQPALVVDGKNDVVVPAINSYNLFRQLPSARLVLYPDSGHGALFQYAEEFVREGLHFLA